MHLKMGEQESVISNAQVIPTWLSLTVERADAIIHEHRNICLESLARHFECQYHAIVMAFLKYHKLCTWWMPTGDYKMNRCKTLQPFWCNV